MEFNVIKEVNVELCESIYALAMNYLKNHDSDELNNLLVVINDIEKVLRKCKEWDSLNKYIILLNDVVRRIEGIVYE